MIERPWLGPSALLLGLLCGVACQEPAGSHDPAPGSSTGDEGTSDEPSGEAPLPDVPAGCGNGIVEGDEACDLGFANADDGACTLACTRSRCGDGLVAASEACDEGEGNGGPTCSDACTVPSRLRWSATLSGQAHGFDIATVVAALPGGAVVVVRQMNEAPETFDAVLDRYEPDGSLAWTTTLPGSLRYSGGQASVAITADEGVLVALPAGPRDSLVADHVVLWRLSPAGEPRWHLVLSPQEQDVPFRGQVVLAGGQVVLVTMHEVGDAFESRVAQLDDDGNVLAEHTPDRLLDVVAGTADGGLVAVTVTGTELVAYDAAGLLQWSTPIPVSDAVLAIDGQGQPVIASDEGAGPPVLRAFSSTGEPRWDAPLELVPRSLAIGDDGTLAVVGTLDAAPMQLSTNVDIGLEVHDAAGEPRFLERVAGPGHGEDIGRGVAITDDGAIWAVGWVAAPLEEADAWIGRFEEDLR